MVSSVPEVEVLLATYNGAHFLREQLDSIFGQDYGNLRVTARDDGSSDGTVAILKEYERKFPGRLRILDASGSSGSAKNNFLLLMQAATADYICFSDQDDVWLPNKVSLTKEAIDRLESRWGQHTPLLAFTNLRVVDEQLKTLHPSFWSFMLVNPDRIDRLATVLVQSMVTGCTAMVNRSLLELARRTPEQAFMHDRWIALLTACVGKAAIVKTPTVLYRQHEENVLGTGRTGAPSGATGNRRSLTERVLQPQIASTQLKYWEMSQREAQALLDTHAAELPGDQQRVLLAFLRCERSSNRWRRVATFLRHGFFYPGIKANLAMAAYLWRLRPKGVRLNP